MRKSTAMQVVSCATAQNFERRQSRLRISALFAQLVDEEIDCFDQAARPRTCKKGQILYLQQEPAEHFYVLCGGWIKLFHTTPEGEEIVVDMLTAGATVGETAIFEDGLHTSSAEIVEDAQLLRLPTALLKSRIGLSPALAFNMLSSMSRHHRRHSGQMALSIMQTAPQRVGSFLLRLCPRNAASGAIFHLPYDKALIAHTLGMKGATFSRALNILKEKTDICVSGSRIEINSLSRLSAFVYGSQAAHFLPEEILGLNCAA